MKHKYPFILLCSLFCVLCFTTRAFDAGNYSGTLNGKPMSLKLANGFIGGSEIHVGHVTYYANSSHAEGNNQMMFQSKYVQNLDYFVLTNMQDSYGTLPAVITGKYFRGRKGMPVKFKLVR
jgi:hypothetical protein